MAKKKVQKKVLVFVCLNKDCANGTSKLDIFPPEGWALVKVSTNTEEGLVAVAEGCLCPTCLGKEMPSLRPTSGPIEVFTKKGK